MAAWGSEQETNPKKSFPGVDDVPPPGGTGGTGNGSGGTGTGDDDDPDSSGSGGTAGAGGPDGDPEGPLLPWGGSSGGCGCTHAGLSYAPQGLWAALVGLWWLRRRRRALDELS